VQNVVADDPSKFQTLAYSFVDKDGDGFTVASAGQLCTAGTLPAGYLAAANGNDCDDGDATRWRFVVLYPDTDGDGVGAGARSVPCLGAAIPAGQSIFGDDADDGNAAVAVDDDDIEDMFVIL
jgi:hypothetical protein